MTWEKFDKIFVILEPEYQNIEIVRNFLDTYFKITDYSNVEFHYTPKNKIIHNIYDTLIKNKIIVDWYNSQVEGDFYDWKDFNHTIYLINLLRRSYELNYERVFFFDKNCFDVNFIQSPKLQDILQKYPIDIDGFVYLNYKNQCCKIGRHINEYYFDCEYSSNMKDINIFSMTKNCIKNVLDNETMILKRLEFYLTDRNMCYDSYVRHIAFNRDLL